MFGPLADRINSGPHILYETTGAACLHGYRGRGADFYLCLAAPCLWKYQRIKICPQGFTIDQPLLGQRCELNSDVARARIPWLTGSCPGGKPKTGATVGGCGNAYLTEHLAIKG